MGKNEMDVHQLFETAFGMISLINSQPRDMRLRTLLLNPDEILKQKNSRDLLLKVQKKVLCLGLEGPPPEGVCRLLDCGLKTDVRVYLHVSDISHVWNVPFNQLDLTCPHLESKVFSTGRAYFWESLLDCYGDNPGMS